MPSNFLAALVRGSSGADPVVGRIVGLNTFEPMGDQTVFTGVGLEDTGFLAGICPANRVKQIADRVFFWHKNVIYEMIDGVWTSVFTVTDQNSASQYGQNHGGLYVWNDFQTGNFGLMGAYKQTPNNYFSAVHYDYNTNTWSKVNSALALTVSDSFLGSNGRYRNVLYYYAPYTSTVLTYDPVTNGFTRVTAPATTPSTNSGFLVAENKLFYFTANSSTERVQLHQNVGGGWVRVVDQPVTRLSNWTTQGAFWPYYAGGSVWLLGVDDSATLGALLFEISLPGYTVTDRTTLLPTYMRPDTTGTTLDEWRFFPVIDQEDPLGSVTTYILWQPGYQGQGLNIFRHDAPHSTTPWVDVGPSQLTGEFSIPVVNQGGSDGIYSEGELFGLLTKLDPAPSGVDLTMRFWGDPLVIQHGAVAGPGFTVGEVVTGGSSGDTAEVARAFANKLWLGKQTGSFQENETITGGGSGSSTTSDILLSHGPITNGPFQVGELITGGTSGTTGNVTVVEDTYIWVSYAAGPGFQNGEVITGGTSTAFATTNAAPAGSSGGASDKFGRLNYDTGENAATTQADISAPASGLVAPMTLSGDDYQTTRADGITEYVLKHETILDGIPSSSPISYMLEIER